MLLKQEDPGYRSMSGPGISVAGPDLARFTNSFQGEITRPGDADYEVRRHVKNVVHDRHPEIIVAPVDADDVAMAVSFAAAMALPIAVRGGGHGSPGFGTVDDGMVIDLSSMHAISIDPIARIGRAEGGTKAGDYTLAAMAHGLDYPVRR